MSERLIIILYYEYTSEGITIGKLYCGNQMLLEISKFQA